MNHTKKLSLYFRLMRLDRPIGILLLLWPTLWALWIASNGHPPWLVLFIFVTGTVLMRSAGCVMNDYADRDIDRHVKRTEHRPITSGEVAPHEALWLAAALALAAFLLILPLNTLTLLLSVPAVLLAGSYPYTKRFLAIPQAYLGIAFGFGIPMAFAAIQGSVPAIAWWLLLANIFWCIAYDTEYAMVDRDDDIHLGIHSSALFFGKHDVLAVMACYAAALAILAYVGNLLHFGIAYYSGLIVAAGIAIYHYTLIRLRMREACFKAFLHNNWFGAVVFAGIVADYFLHN
ncbi:MAG: 4-hydroxybenzoate polyprenyltransferase [Gallionellales bacterium 35-53-114]|jgi:4-hydroxybenzoate polyprenyltransferase|nr:MAG: 4-hydroxybenzoate polyprenyltransferase [Gallionellales bacterium 35-53-114]OYZ64535.1 MAG: 4-hydroxybenzoate polyprenyltransferase [Gallionellales bacterium 24-53-125]OZB10159.1 MAG: 4-hydroxybenzoate polyprenyltransferase [Gallionellales bacterium 39-52-133]HQS56746.1 4-hydroxybenzoate octaprenyltransferase [Gallionellaceae bacterium]HQS75470.1 4-hydroxybenzoate octaprenyltransferase [Gallionellaceae bacterium]